MTPSAELGPVVPVVHATCGCGHDTSGPPVLDVRPIPHAIRHATVFGALDAMAPGEPLVIIAPHAPLPLLRQLEERGPIDVEFLVDGPDEWRVQITRR